MKKKLLSLLAFAVLAVATIVLLTGCPSSQTGIEKIYSIYLMDSNGWIMGFEDNEATKIVNVNNDACDRIYAFSGKLFIASGKGWGSDKPGEIISWDPRQPYQSPIHLEPTDGASVWAMVFINDSKAYATLSNDNAYNGGVWIFDPSDLSKGATLISGSEGGNPEGIILVGKYAYVAYSGYSDSTNGNVVKVIDTDNDTIVATISVGTNPQALVASSDGSKVYVANTGSYNFTTYSYENCSISVIDTSSNTVTSTIAMPDGTGPSILAITDDGKLYTTGYGANIYYIDTTASTPTPVALTTQQKGGSVMLLIGNKLYITNPDYTAGSVYSKITIIDTSTNTEISGSPIEVGDVDTEVSGITTYSLY